MSQRGKSREVIFETISCGNSLKVSAIDAETGIEVSIIAPTDADKTYIRKIAARKLEKRMQGKTDKDEGADKPTGGPGGITI